MKEEMGKKIVLIGMPGSGKSTVGRQLADRTDIPFFDTDAMISEALNQSIADLIASKGEPYFRHKESLVIQRLLRPFYGVLATGGGAVMDQHIRPLFRLHGVVYLRASIETLAARLAGSHDRPLLKGGDSLEEQLQATFAVRQPVYEALANLTLDVDHASPAQLVETIAAHFGLALDEAGFAIDTEELVDEY